MGIDVSSFNLQIYNLLINLMCINCSKESKNRFLNNRLYLISHGKDPDLH